MKHPYVVRSLSEVLASMTGLQRIVVTVTGTSDKEFEDGPKKRLALQVWVKEYPRNPYYPSPGKGGGIDRLYAALGNDQAAWIGKTITLVRVRNQYEPHTKKRADKFHVVVPERQRVPAGMNHLQG